MSLYLANNFGDLGIDSIERFLVLVGMIIIGLIAIAYFERNDMPDSFSNPNRAAKPEKREWTAEDKAFLGLALWPYGKFEYRPEPIAWIRADGKLLDAPTPGNVDCGMTIYPLFGQPYRSWWSRVVLYARRRMFTAGWLKPKGVTPKKETESATLLEYAECTLCSAVPSEGFYTGCMIRDGATQSDWRCDGAGNLVRPQRVSKHRLSGLSTKNGGQDAQL